MNNFEKASRLKLRFQTSRGSLNSEDLWTLPLAELDALAVHYDTQLEAKAVKSYRNTKSVNPKIQLSRDIAVYVIKSREDEVKAKENKLINDSEIAKVEAALKEIEDTEFKNLSKGQLNEKLAKLKA